MNKITKIILAIIGGCSVVMDMLTPLAIALFWDYLFRLEGLYSVLVFLIGGLATLFRAIKIGWLNNE